MVLDDFEAVFTHDPIHTVSGPRHLGISKADTQVADVSQLGVRCRVTWFAHEQDHTKH